tara:strand:+ start:6732 stop:7052 length:321 start_codon:yes stop_codon:yes gene_type:complete
MANTFHAITIGLKVAGCTDPTAANYNPKAEISDGNCFNSAFENCTEDLLMSASLLDCSSAEAKKALKVYALYDGYKQAVRESNQTKIDIYSKQLADMCNAEYCETC